MPAVVVAADLADALNKYVQDNQIFNEKKEEVCAVLQQVRSMVEFMCDNQGLIPDKLDKQKVLSVISGLQQEYNSTIASKRR